MLKKPETVSRSTMEIQINFDHRPRLIPLCFHEYSQNYHILYKNKSGGKLCRNCCTFSRLVPLQTNVLFTGLWIEEPIALSAGNCRTRCSLPQQNYLAATTIAITVLASFASVSPVFGHVRPTSVGGSPSSKFQTPSLGSCTCGCKQMLRLLLRQ